MANRIIRHYYDEEPVSSFSTSEIKEPDKTKSISELTSNDLRKLISRLGMEREAEQLIRELRKSSGEKDSYDSPLKIDTKTPVDQLYHHGILGQKWGIRRFQNDDGTRTSAGKKKEEDPSLSEQYTQNKLALRKSVGGRLNQKQKKTAYDIEDGLQKYENELNQNLGSKVLVKVLNKGYNETVKVLNRAATKKDKTYLLKFLEESDGVDMNYIQGILKKNVKHSSIQDNYNDDVLAHHGILGQKWGRRRFQNEDGTRTSAGKKREQTISKSEDHKESREFKSKATIGLSNNELKKLNERLQLEETYKKLSAERLKRSQSFVKKAITKAGSDAFSEFSKGVLLGGAKLLVKKMSPEFAELSFGIKIKKD